MKIKNRVLGMLIVLGMGLTSCEKEPINEYENEQSNCSCGIIANDGINNGCYWLEIRNNCSGNKKKFCFDEDIWMNAHVGESFCVTGVSEW